MSLRHDGDLPPLTPEQQAEAIRLAARLQVEHEAQASSAALLQAAEEAGIERRFLDQAVAQVVSTPIHPKPTFRASHPAAVWGLGAMLTVLIGSGFAYPPLLACAMIGFLFAIFPTVSGRSRATVAGLVVASWLLFDVMLWVLHFDVEGEFTKAALLEIGGAVLGMILAELAVAVPSRRASNRPQSL